MENKLVFIDETGDPGRNQEPSSSYLFIITAVVVSRSKVVALQKFIQRSREKYAPKKKELKFSNLNKNARLDIFRGLAKHDFSFYSIVVDKSALVSKGFLYASPFYKYFFGHLIGLLAESHSVAELHFDNYGNAKFQAELRKYVRRNYFQPELFEPGLFLAHDSEESELTQLADLVAGSVGRAFGARRGRRQDKTFITLIGAQHSGTKFWPRPCSEFAHSDEIEWSEDDEALEQESERRAKLFIESHRGTRKPAVYGQMAVAEYFLYSDEYVSGTELAQYLYELGYIPPEYDVFDRRRWMQRNVIRVLRDARVLICGRSGSQEHGYKLIRRVSEGREFTHSQTKRAIAMLRRGEDVRQAVLNVGGPDVRELSEELLADSAQCGIQFTGNSVSSTSFSRVDAKAYSAVGRDGRVGREDVGIAQVAVVGQDGPRQDTPAAPDHGHRQADRSVGLRVKTGQNYFNFIV